MARNRLNGILGTHNDESPNYEDADQFLSTTLELYHQRSTFLGKGKAADTKTGKNPKPIIATD